MHTGLEQSSHVICMNTALTQDISELEMQLSLDTSAPV